MYNNDMFPYSVTGGGPQGKANIYDDLLDTLKLLEEDPEPLRQSEKVYMFMHVYQDTSTSYIYILYCAYKQKNILYMHDVRGW